MSTQSNTSSSSSSAFASASTSTSTPLPLPPSQPPPHPDNTSHPSRLHLTHRTVCCSIPVCTRTSRILMVTSRKHQDKWIFPKGGREEGEELVEAAVRESWEEGGTRKGMEGWWDGVEVDNGVDEVKKKDGNGKEISGIGSTSASSTSTHTPAGSIPRPRWTAMEVHRASARSGNGEREIDYHVFEIEIDGDELEEEWPESSQRKRELVSVPEVIRRCVAWRNEKNTKLELVDGFRRTRVYKRWRERVDRGEEEGPPRRSMGGDAGMKAINGNGNGNGTATTTIPVNTDGRNTSPTSTDTSSTTSSERERNRLEFKEEEEWVLEQWAAGQKERNQVISGSAADGKDLGLGEEEGSEGPKR